MAKKKQRRKKGFSLTNIALLAVGIYLLTRKEAQPPKGPATSATLPNPPRQVPGVSRLKKRVSSYI